MSEPTTPSGQALLEDYAAGDMHPDDLDTLARWIVKIEAEARLQDVARLMYEIEQSAGVGGLIGLSVVRRILEGASRG